MLHIITIMQTGTTGMTHIKYLTQQVRFHSCYTIGLYLVAQNSFCSISNSMQPGTMGMTPIKSLAQQVRLYSCSQHLCFCCSR
jgi:hypothetical protein